MEGKSLVKRLAREAASFLMIELFNMALHELRGYLRAIEPQLIVIGLVATLFILSRLTFIPAPTEIAIFAINLLATYGLPLIMLASFIENFAGLGAYVPGSIAILAAMAATAGNPLQATITFFAIVMPAVLGNVLSYYVGYFTRPPENINLPERSTKNLIFWYASTYWHPQLAAVSAMASGSGGIKFPRYFAHFLPVSLLWSIFWAVVMYNAGKVVATPGFLAPLFYIYLLGWVVWGLHKHHKSLSSQI